MMKERTNTKSVAPRKVKGTVLFTVITVMMILVVFLMGALALAATANKRAMKSYSEAQTQATAKAGVHALMSAIQNDVSAARAASDLSKTNPVIELNEDDIKFESNLTYNATTKKYEGTSTGALGKITHAEIRYVGHKFILSGGEMKEKAVIKFSATAQQSGAESTYSVYMLRDIVSDEGGGGGGGGGFVTTGSAAAGNHTSAFGGTYIGFNKGLTTPVSLNPGNESILETPVNITGDLKSDGRVGKVDIVISGPGQGLTVWGDIDFTNQNGSGLDILTVNATKDKDVMKDLDYIKIPYIFADGAFKIQQANTVIGHPDIPLNIFCGYFEHHKDWGKLAIYADLICHDADGTSILGGTYPDSGLMKWVGSVVNPVDSSKPGYHGGNIYTKGSLKIQADGSIGDDGDREYTANGATVKVKNEFLIQGDVIVEKNLNLDGGVTVVDGNCTVKGNITGTGALVVTGTLFCPNSTSVTVHAKTETTGGQNFPANYEYTKITQGVGTNKEGQIIKRPEDIMKEIDPFNTTTSVPASEAGKVSSNVLYLNGSSVTSEGTGTGFYKVDGNKLTIYDSCTIYGKKDGGSIYVDPLVDNPEFDSTKPESATNKKKIVPMQDNPDYDASKSESATNPKKIPKPICIKIAGGPKTEHIYSRGEWGDDENRFVMTNNANIMLNDLDGGAVDFFLASDFDLKCGGKAVWTEKLDDLCSGSGFYIATDSNYARTDVPQLSNLGVTFYADEDEHVFNTGDRTNIVAANISMPYTKMVHKPGSDSIYNYCSASAKIYYNNLELKEEDGTYTGKVFTKAFSSKVGILGCCIVKELDTDNDWVMVYVPRKVVKSTGKKDLEDAILVGWQTLYYENY